MHAATSSRIEKEGALPPTDRAAGRARASPKAEKAGNGDDHNDQADDVD